MNFQLTSTKFSLIFSFFIGLVTPESSLDQMARETLEFPEPELFGQSTSSAFQSSDKSGNEIENGNNEEFDNYSKDIPASTETVASSASSTSTISTPVADPRLTAIWTYLSEAQLKDVNYISMVYNNINTIYDLERYISTLISNDATINFLVTPPGVATPMTWAFLHLKRIVKDLNMLAMALHYDGCDDPVRRPHCKVMRLSDEYSPPLICPHVNKKPKYCTALEYVFHALDHGAYTLNYGRIDSRQPLARVNPSISHRQLCAAYRRVLQVFRHTWHFHRAIFLRHEQTTKMYQRFVAIGIYTKMLPHVPLPGFELGFAQEDVTGLNEETYMRQLTFLVSNAHASLSDPFASRATYVHLPQQ